jgi:hypothetical protein
MSHAISAQLFYFFRAAAKATAAKIRSAGLVREHARWTERAAVCERCPLRVIQCNRSYCGKPFLQLPARDLTVDGCGCPCREKAKDPSEHCPLTSDHQASRQAGGRCNCKWCKALGEN